MRCDTHNPRGHARIIPHPVLDPGIGLSKGTHSVARSALERMNWFDARIEVEKETKPRLLGPRRSPVGRKQPLRNSKQGSCNETGKGGCRELGWSERRTSVLVCRGGCSSL